VPGKDKTLHFIAYGVLTGLILWGWVRNISAGILGGVVMGLFLLGAMDEITQPYVNRTCDFYDWLMDISGVIVVVMLWVGIKKYRRKEQLPPVEET
jgi:VanZ family protein